MDKSNRKAAIPKLKRVHSVHPWEVQHFDNYSSIKAWVEISVPSQMEIIAVIQGINHVAVADFIAKLANLYNQNPSLFQSMLDLKMEQLCA